MTTAVTCRCCGKSVWINDGHPIHTSCIRRHWSHHVRGLSASRCREFNKTKGGQNVHQAY